MDIPLSPLAKTLVAEFEKSETPDRDRKISVSPIVSKVASLYESLRNALDYRDEEVILRAAIERILKRRFLFGETGEKMAEPLVRELVWARYFPDETISESKIAKVREQIDLFSNLRKKILEKHPSLRQSTVNEWIYHLMSSRIENIVTLRKSKEIMTNFMFEVMKQNIKIADDDEQTRDVQVFIAVHKTFSKDDLAFLRYNLFKQIFGDLSEANIEFVSDNFLKGLKEVGSQLNYPRKDKIFNYVKDKTAVFFILEDLLTLERGKVTRLLQNEEELSKKVYEICETRYLGISSRIRRAIIRSIIFILITKTVIAIGVEGTFERIFYGEIIIPTLVLNISFPPILMATMSLLIKTPGNENSKKIFHYIKVLLIDEDSRFSNTLVARKAAPKSKPLLNTIFTISWLATFVLVFGFVVYVLTMLKFNFFSIGIFVFFLALASFFAYRINQSAQLYTMEKKKNLFTPISDFLILPIVQTGRHLSMGVRQLNFFLFIFDFIIEAPFKELSSFFEQWFLFLQNKREEMEI